MTIIIILMLISISTVAFNCPHTNPALIVTNPISVKPNYNFL